MAKKKGPYVEIIGKWKHEYIAPGIRYIRDAKTGELLAFIEGEEDDDMTDEQEDD